MHEGNERSGPVTNTKFETRRNLTLIVVFPNAEKGACFSVGVLVAERDCFGANLLFSFGVVDNPPSANDGRAVLGEI